MIDNSIYQILAATSNITAVVGSDIYTVIAAQQDLSAYIVIHLIDDVAENTKDNPSMLDEIRVQVNCYHGIKATCDDLGKKIRTALDNYRGTVGGNVIDRAYFEDAHNDFDEDRKLYILSQDFIVRQKRS